MPLRVQKELLDHGWLSKASYDELINEYKKCESEAKSSKEKAYNNQAWLQAISDELLRTFQVDINELRMLKRIPLCRWRGHPAGVVWLNPDGLEPDMSCRECGDDLG